MTGDHVPVIVGTSNEGDYVECAACGKDLTFNPDMSGCPNYQPPRRSMIREAIARYLRGHSGRNRGEEIQALEADRWYHSTQDGCEIIRELIQYHEPGTDAHLQAKLRARNYLQAHYVDPNRADVRTGLYDQDATGAAVSGNPESEDA
jgi:hypothetical protein